MKLDEQGKDAFLLEWESNILSTNLMNEQDYELENCSFANKTNLEKYISNIEQNTANVDKTIIKELISYIPTMSNNEYCLNDYLTIRDLYKETNNLDLLKEAIGDNEIALELAEKVFKNQTIASNSFDNGSF